MSVDRQQFVDLLNQSLTMIDLDEVQMVRVKHCTTFDQLINVYSEHLTLTPSFTDCLAICLAIHISVKLEGEPCWLYLVGAPSSGKSTICELLSADEHHTRPLSKFTGLVSGSRQGSHLIPLLQNKCVIVKDGTLLLESTPQQLGNVYGELRDIFDGSLEAHYRNGVKASFTNISFGMIIGITERIYSINMSALGERFLHCRLETSRDTETQRNATAIRRILQSCRLNVTEGGTDGDQRQFPKQREYTAGFLSHLHNRLINESILQPTFTDGDCLHIQALADMVACSRASAPRKGNEDITYDSRPEASTRLVKQLTRLALCLCYVFNVQRITPKIRELLTKVAEDTSFGRQHTIIKCVALSANGLNKQAVAVQTEVPLETLNRRIDDLISLGVLVKNKETSRQGVGRRNHILSCPDWVESAFRTIYTPQPVRRKP